MHRKEALLGEVQQNHVSSGSYPLTRPPAVLWSKRAPLKLASL